MLAINAAELGSTATAEMSWFYPVRRRDCAELLRQAHDAPRFQLEARQASSRNELSRNAEQQSIVQPLGDLLRQTHLGPEQWIQKYTQLGHGALGKNFDA